MQHAMKLVVGGARPGRRPKLRWVDRLNADTIKKRFAQVVVAQDKVNWKSKTGLADSKSM